MTILVFCVSWAGHSQSSWPTVLSEDATWYQWPLLQGGNDHWYGWVRRSLPGSDADRIAKQWGGQLVDYPDAEERDILLQIAKIQFHSLPYWTGLFAPPGGAFRWSDGTPFHREGPPFENWTNLTDSVQRMMITPFGGELIGVDPSYAASIFEITAHPSKLAAAIAQVTVKSLGNTVSDWPVVVSGPVRVRFPGTARFGVLVLGPGPFEYQWKVGGLPVPQATNQFFEFQLNTETSGAVSVEVNNANGGQESVPAPIEVIPIVATGTSNFWKQWTHIRGGNDHWYGVCYRREGFTRAQAREFARRLGADLVTLQSPEENAQFRSLFFEHLYQCWLGVTRNSEGGWDWLDGSPATDLQWAPGQPDPAETSAGVLFQLHENGLCRVVPEHYIPTSVAMERTNSPVEIPPILLDELPPRRIPVGSAQPLSFDVLGGPLLSYEWRRGSYPLPGQTNAVLELNPTSVLESGEYFLVVSNAYGVATSAPVSVSVFLPTPLTLKLSLGEGQALLEFEHPSDAETIVMEHSWDLIHWWRDDESRIPGSRQWSAPIPSESGQIYYRIRSLP